MLKTTYIKTSIQIHGKQYKVDSFFFYYYYYYDFESH